jgi:hypothetical protein
MAFDTTPEAAAVQEAIVREMTTAQRLALALEMSDPLGNVALAGVRLRYPEFSDEECSRELLRIMYGFGAPR